MNPLLITGALGIADRAITLINDLRNRPAPQAAKPADNTVSFSRVLQSVTPVDEALRNALKNLPGVQSALASIPRGQAADVVLNSLGDVQIETAGTIQNVTLDGPSKAIARSVFASIAKLQYGGTSAIRIAC